MQVFLKKADAGWSDRIHEQRPIQKEVSSLAARLCNDETTVAGGTVKSSVVGGSRRIVISTNGIAGVRPLPFEGILQDLREPAADLDKTSKGALISRRGGVDEDSDIGSSVAETRRYVDALVDRASGITAIDGNFRNQCMRSRMCEQVFRTKLVANSVIGYVLSPLAALLEPPISTDLQRRDSILDLRPRSPVLKRTAIESKQKSFAKLFIGWQPVLVSSKPGAPHREGHVFELIGNDRSRLEPSETVQAGHFSQPMYGNQRGPAKRASCRDPMRSSEVFRRAGARQASES